MLEDLQRQQRRARLKPQALERELSLDLRSDSGLFRSTLLHRLNALQVPWGKLADVGRSRGTFRERWVLRWEPEYAVRLVEHLVFGPTIAQAAEGRLAALIGAESRLAALAELVQGAMTAQLDGAARRGIAALDLRASQTSDRGELLSALSPMAEVLRYGQARAGGGERLADLVRRIMTQAAIALPYAARGLDDDAAAMLFGTLDEAHGAILLAEIAGDDLEQWYAALEALRTDKQATAIIAGTAARLLYEADRMTAPEAATMLGRRLSPGTTSAEAAGFFEGFFSGAGARLIYDHALRAAVDNWLKGLAEDDFVHSLPILRRVFAELDAMERKRLLDAVAGRGDGMMAGRQPAPDGGARWATHLALIGDILRSGAAE